MNLQQFLEQIEELDKKATEEPWGFTYDGSGDFSLGLRIDPQEERILRCQSRNEGQVVEDLKFIVQSRTLLPKAAKVIRYLIGDVEYYLAENPEILSKILEGSE